MAFSQSSLQEKRIELHRPAPGQAVVISLAEESVLVFGFNLEDQIMTVQGEDLHITFPGGASITLVNFFAGGIQESPHIELGDGSAYSGLEFFTRFEPLLLEAVQAQGSHESGLPAYNDDPGSLIAGVDRLGALGTDYWGRGTEPDITQIGLTEQGGKDEDAGPPVITMAGSLVIVAQMHEDGQPDQYRLASGADPATGSRDDSLETPYDTATGMPSASGAAKTFDDQSAQVNVTPITDTPSGEASSAPDNDGGYTLAGRYGQLVLNANGTHTYTMNDDAVMGAEFITKSVTSSLGTDEAIPLPDTPETEDPYGDEADYDSPSALLAMAAFGIDVEAHLTAKANEGLEDLSAYHDLSPTGVAAAALYATGLYDQEDTCKESTPDVEDPNFAAVSRVHDILVTSFSADGVPPEIEPEHSPAPYPSGRLRARTPALTPCGRPMMKPLVPKE